MLRRNLGLTDLYNLVNDRGTADATDADVARMRRSTSSLIGRSWMPMGGTMYRWSMGSTHTGK